MVQETPTKEELLAWQEIAGVDRKRFVNTNGKQYKDLGLRETIDSLSDAELFGLLEKDGMLVKRPILVGDGFVLVGFKKDEWEAALT